MWMYMLMFVYKTYAYILISSPLLIPSPPPWMSNFPSHSDLYLSLLFSFLLFFWLWSLVDLRISIYFAPHTLSWPLVLYTIHHSPIEPVWSFIHLVLIVSTSLRVCNFSFLKQVNKSMHHHIALHTLKYWLHHNKKPSPYLCGYHHLVESNITPLKGVTCLVLVLAGNIEIALSI